MSLKTCTPEEATAILKKDVLANISPLKMISNFPNGIHCLKAEVKGELGLCVLLNPLVSPYDATYYGDQEYVVFLYVEGEYAARELVENLPIQNKAVFKIGDRISKTIVSKHFNLDKKRAVISFTSNRNQPEMPVATNVKISIEWNQQIANLIKENGYSDDEVKTWLNTGAFFVSYQVDDLAACACICYPNCEEVWEIGALFTLEQFRRRGFAREVVKTAVSELLKRNRKIRYAVREENISSATLAKSIGLETFQTLEHYLGKRIVC